ncbi:635_t:CDS:2 [Cetraspora pellucida]|uniref:635_t:CDS:1 n=1 Tax=Cetraspora pellucida TaxID=1433469 RepID=A0A9N8VSC0_9GLOM|nr:635_t:CDS:2 [Cetraspora pellucida]
MVEWTYAQTCTLIEERRNRNIEYHSHRRNRNIFWNSIANRINQEHNTNFTGYHCKEKFLNLVQSYNRPEDEFDRIRILNTSNYRWNRDVENITPVPPIEEVEHVLSMRSFVRRINQSPSIISRRSQRHSPYPGSPHDNTNINNPGMRNFEQNISVPSPPIETLSSQPSLYSRVTDEAQNYNQSQDSSNYEVAVSSSNLTPDLLNLSLSRNENDAIMHDIGSQPLFPINEEER